MLNVRKSILWSAAFLCMSCLLAGVVQAQGQQRGFGGSSSLDLLRRDDVRQELELLDEQVAQITALGEKTRNALRETFSGLRNLSQEDRREQFEKMRGKLEASNRKLEKQVSDEILLPHQSQRLAQIRFQMQLRRSGGSGAFTSPPVVEALGISEQQRETLQELQSQSDQELREQIAKLREKARNEILNQLTSQQRAKYEKLVGKPFDFSSEPQRGGGRRGGDGGRGGQRRR